MDITDEIKKLANEKYPIVPLKPLTGDKDKDLDNFRITIQSIGMNHGFIEGYKEALKTINR